MKLRYCDGGSFSGDAKFDNGVSLHSHLKFSLLCNILLDLE